MSQPSGGCRQVDSMHSHHVLSVPGYSTLSVQAHKTRRLKHMLVSVQNNAVAWQRAADLSWQQCPNTPHAFKCVCER